MHRRLANLSPKNICDDTRSTLLLSFTVNDFIACSLGTYVESYSNIKEHEEIISALPDVESIDLPALRAVVHEATCVWI